MTHRCAFDLKDLPSFRPLLAGLLTCWILITSVKTDRQATAGVNLIRVRVGVEAGVGIEALGACIKVTLIGVKRLALVSHIMRQSMPSLHVNGTSRLHIRGPERASVSIPDLQ